MLLSDRLARLHQGYQGLDDLSGCVEQALAMEAEVYEWPKQRKEDPPTSHFDGSIGSLKKNQQYVFTVFKILGGPIDTVTLEEGYLMLNLPTQAPSGIRTRRKELSRLGLIEWVDSLGVSPMGRSARRWQVRKASHEGNE
jgi:hypothetical protein